MNRKLFLSLLAFIGILVSCSDPEAENKKFNYQLDSLHYVLNSRDSAVNDMLASFNEIARNLDSVTSKQNRISWNVSGYKSEIKPDIREHIRREIIVINDIIEDNRKKIDGLNLKLKRSSTRISELSSMVTALNEQIERKNEESQLLNKKLNDLSIEVIQLQAFVDLLSRHSNTQAEMIASQDSAMHAAYYIIGRSKQLTELKVIDQAGGLLGLGKTQRLNPELSKEHFTLINSLTTVRIPVEGKDPKLITTHPKNSYSLEKVSEQKYSLLIREPEQFWSTTKYLVISLR